MRLVGVVSLFAVALFLCRALSEHEEKRIKTVESLASLLRRMKTMILCYRMPLDEIYRGIPEGELSELGILPSLWERGDLRAVLSDRSSSLLLSSELRRRLTELADAVGRGDRDSAAELCEYYIGELSREALELRAAAPKRLGLYRSLVVTGMLMLVIVFI